MSADPFTCDISRHIWETRYRYRDGEAIHDQTVADTWKRIANALAGVENRDRTAWAEHFYRALEDFRFLPGGTHPGRQQHRPAGHAVQLLRHGTHCSIEREAD